MTDNRFTAISKTTGQVLYAGTAYDPQALASEDVLILEGVEYDGGYLDGDVHHNLPPQPSKYHTFDYAAKQWIDPRTPETQWPVVRAERDRRLLASDWTQLPDVLLATKEVWAAYRQALRDITEQLDPFNIVWPTAPQ